MSKQDGPLPPGVAAALRGEGSCAPECAPLVQAGRGPYRDGRAGAPCPPLSLPGYPPHLVRALGRYLHACWEQGKQDGGGCGPSAPEE